MYNLRAQCEKRIVGERFNKNTGGVAKKIAIEGAGFTRAFDFASPYVLAVGSFQMDTQVFKMALGAPPTLDLVVSIKRYWVLRSVALENARRDQEKSAVHGVDLGFAVVDH